MKNDFGWFDSTDTWTSVEFESSHYWSFKPMKDQCLRSIALSFWTAFVEVGRVADSWELAELHRDMKWDVVLSLRIMAHKQVVRIELVGVGILFDIGQSF